MCFSSGGGGVGAKQMRADQQERQRKLDSARGSVANTFAQFDDDYFGKRKQAFLDYNVPQLNDQYQQAQKNTLYGLARQGNLQSSAAGERFGDLGKDYARQSTAVQGAAGDFENQQRKEVETNRSDVLSQYGATEDADATAASAQARARMLSAMPSFSPLGALFANTTGVLANQANARDMSMLTGGGDSGSAWGNLGKLFNSSGSSTLVKS